MKKLLTFVLALVPLAAGAQEIFDASLLLTVAGVEDSGVYALIPEEAANTPEWLELRSDALFIRQDPHQAVFPLQQTVEELKMSKQMLGGKDDEATKELLASLDEAIDELEQRIQRTLAEIDARKPLLPEEMVWALKAYAMGHTFYREAEMSEGNVILCQNDEGLWGAYAADGTPAAPFEFETTEDLREFLAEP